MNLDLITPIVASVAIFAVVVLAIMLIRQGRALRRLDGRIVEREGAAAQASLDRIAVLRARPTLGAGVAAVATGTEGSTGGRSRLLVGGLGLLAAAGLGTAYVMTRGPGSAPSGGSTTPVIRPPGPLEMPATAPAIDRAAHVVAVFNGSGVPGAAGQVIAPQLRTVGYSVPDNLIKNAERQDIAETVVMFKPGQKGLAVNLAFDLHVTKLARLDGVRAEGLPTAEAVVVVGRDLAAQSTQGSVTAP